MEEYTDVINYLKCKFNESYSNESVLLDYDTDDFLKIKLVYKNIDIKFSEDMAYFLKDDKVILMQSKYLISDIVKRASYGAEIGEDISVWLRVFEVLNGLLYVFNDDFEMFYEDISFDNQLVIVSILEKM